ncbi:hypothetical protein [Methanolapillus millepedarum]|uniref:Uncharacterized protein n=1 Tax=Methanolapillus millepedarum TaxID=3028296 RepID=A0AA96V2Q8_9EURY|nr:hypothetical protein MsAc7_04870 [Methanosarcinaceae archaeon Ac7]
MAQDYFLQNQTPNRPANNNAEMKREDIFEMVSALYPDSVLAGNGTFESSGLSSSSLPLNAYLGVFSDFGPRLSSFEGGGLDAKEVCVISSFEMLETATMASLGIKNPSNCLLVVLDECADTELWTPSFKYEGLSSGSGFPVSIFGPVAEVRHPLEFKKALQRMKCGTLVVQVLPTGRKTTLSIGKSDFL